MGAVLLKVVYFMVRSGPAEFWPHQILTDIGREAANTSASIIKNRISHIPVVVVRPPASYQEHYRQTINVLVGKLQNCRLSDSHRQMLDALDPEVTVIPSRLFRILGSLRLTAGSGLQGPLHGGALYIVLTVIDADLEVWLRSHTGPLLVYARKAHELGGSLWGGHVHEFHTEYDSETGAIVSRRFE